MKLKALFIHGFKGSHNSSTGKVVSKVLSDDFDFIIPDFDLLDVERTLSKIDDICNSEKIKLIVGTSLGGFYTLAYSGFVEKIVLNPCMRPSIELPKLDSSISSDILDEFLDYEDIIFDADNAGNTRGIFGTKDELFGDKYMKEFKHYYGDKNTYTFSGGHHGAAGAEEAIMKAVQDSGLVDYDIAEHEWAEMMNEPFETHLFHRKRQLKEAFVNVFSDSDKNYEYRDEIYDMFVQGYKKIGGMLGINSEEDFYNEVDMVKAIRRTDKLTAACAYTFKRGGRKLVACTAIPEGKADLIKIMKDDIRLTDRGFWGEVSDAPLHMYTKYAHAPVINPEEIKKAMSDKKFIDVDEADWADDPDVKPGHENEKIGTYMRSIAGEFHPKVAIGNHFGPDSIIFQH